MDIGKVVGRTFYSFVGQNGRPVEMYKFFCTFNAPLSDPMFIGEQCAAYTVQRSLYDTWIKNGFYIPEVGDPCVLRYDKKGRLEQFDPLPEYVSDSKGK